MTIDQLADYLRNTLCGEHAFESYQDFNVHCRNTEYILFPTAIRGQHAMFNDRYATLYAVVIRKDENTGRVIYVKISHYTPKFFKDGSLRKYAYNELSIYDHQQIDMKFIGEILTDTITTSEALLKRHAADAELKLLLEIEKL